MFIQTIRIEVGNLLGLEKDKDAFLELKELTTHEVLNLRKASSKGDVSTISFYKKILPELIVDHNFYEDEKNKMTNKDVMNLIFEKIELATKVMNDYSNKIFFYPDEESRMQIGSLCAEVFNGRYNEELYREYGSFLPYITDVFLPICNTENGDLLHLPYEGGILDQPYITMQIIKVIQLNYRKYLSDKQKKMMQKNRMR